MIRLFTKILWGVRHQFMKYFFVGASSFLLDMSLLIFIRESFGLAASLAVVINQSIIIAYNFTLNKYWSFANRDMPHRQFVRYMTLAIWNYLFAVTAMYLLSDIIGFDYRLVRLGSVLVAVFWNFYLYRQWVYR